MNIDANEYHNAQFADGELPIHIDSLTDSMGGAVPTISPTRALQNLPHIWSNLAGRASKPVTEASLNEFIGLIKGEDARFHVDLESRCRDNDRRIAVRILCTTHDVLKISGFLEQLAAANKVVIATNTKTTAQAQYAAMARIVSHAPLGNEVALSRVSRIAKGVSGIAVLCEQDELAISIANAQEIFERVRNHTQQQLFELADKARASDELGSVENKAEPASVDDAKSDDATTSITSTETNALDELLAGLDEVGCIKLPHLKGQELTAATLIAVQIGPHFKLFGPIAGGIENVQHLRNLAMGIGASEGAL